MTTIANKMYGAAVLAGCLSLLWMGFAPRAAAQYRDEIARLRQYAGVYVLPSGVRLMVEVADEGLAVRPAGREQPGARPEAWSGFERQAGAILAGLSVDDTAPLEAALRDARRERAVADITYLFDVFTGGHGALRGYRVLGTAALDDGRVWTLVHVTFDKGHEVVRFVWKDGRLATVQRGAYPAVGARYAATTRFKPASGRSEITFNLRTNGTVESMTVAGRHGAVTAYRLADASPLQ